LGAHSLRQSSVMVTINADFPPIFFDPCRDRYFLLENPRMKPLNVSGVPIYVIWFKVKYVDNSATVSVGFPKVP